MAVNTAAGSVVSLGTTKAAAVQADFESDTYVPIAEVESIGEFGDQNAVVNFTALANSRVRKRKGSADAGSVAIVVGKDPTDPGQLALNAAQKTKFEYNLKIELADKSGAAGSKNTIFYLRVIVMSNRNNPGNNDNIVRVTYNCEINAAPIEVPGT